MSQIPVSDPTSLNLSNIQGDILVGVPKKVERYVFFEIGEDVEKFRANLTDLVPFVTSTKSLVETRNRFKQLKEEAARERSPFPLQPIVGLTIGFSAKGLGKLGQSLDDLQEQEFKDGQFKDAKALGDPTTADGEPKWLSAYTKPIDFVLDIAGDSWKSVEGLWHRIEHIFGIGTKHATVKIMHHINGNVRPHENEGHEHFGFKDGISQPLIKDFDQTPTDSKTPQPINASNILLGHDGKPPAWTDDGTFLAFRQLAQLVPEFDKFLHDNPIDEPGLSREKGSELLGARFVGRWKSGAPIDVTPLHDDKELANDPERNNAFDFSGATDQSRCPFSAHVRKTNPRTDLTNLGANFDNRRLIRRSIPYGPEVSNAEKHAHKTHTERGLAFACYNVSITNGFHFVQTQWANATDFPPQKKVPIGFDPIVGQNGNNERTVAGTDPNPDVEQQNKSITLPFDFVVPRGGEYFFVPSISTLRDVFAFGVHIASV